MEVKTNGGMDWNNEPPKSGVVSGKPQSVGSLTIVGDHEELLRRFCHYRDALDYCLATLKHHHMTKRGISTLVAKTEKIKDRSNRGICGK